ncbi:MAG: hypothetical protein DRN06_08080 [Thermoprotei archaeon]|nr:MAG: hypothetical protein DRN06_08080 [Thermoprotei archaeon]
MTINNYSQGVSSQQFEVMRDLWLNVLFPYPGRVSYPQVFQRPDPLSELLEYPVGRVRYEVVLEAIFRGLNLPLRKVEPKAKLFLLNLIMTGEIKIKGFIEALNAASRALSRLEWELNLLYVEDEEIENWTYIAFEYVIRRADYEELQDIWDELIAIFHENLGDRTMRYVSVWVVSGSHEQGIQT